MAGASVDAIALKEGLDERPYQPSWVDRLTERIESLPGPSWLVYAIAALLLFAVETLVKWAEGVYPAGVLFPFHSVLSGGAILAFGLVDYLDKVADRALSRFSPALTADAATERLLRYRLTTLPARPTLLVTVAFVLLGGAMTWLLLATNPGNLEVLKLGGGPISLAVDTLFSALAWIGVGVFVYHSLHQLGTVSLILERHTRYDCFELQPLYALSDLTARTTFVLTISVLCWATSLPEVLSLPGSVPAVIAYVFIAGIVFVTPLLGVHQALQREREQLQLEASRRLRAALQELHRRTDAGELEGMDQFQATLDGLIKERELLEKISTGPWQPDTLRAVVTALLLPLLLLLAQRLVEFFWRF